MLDPEELYQEMLEGDAAAEEAKAQIGLEAQNDESHRADPTVIVEVYERQK